MSVFKAYCGLCDYETERDSDRFDGQCPWHNHAVNGELRYDEFPQDSYGEDY